jgi:hypothetical protein
LGANAAGGGLAAQPGMSFPVDLSGSILAGNTAEGDNPDVRADVFDLTADYSLIGDADGIVIAGAGNLVGDNQAGGIIDPRLSQLDDHGGPTLTHSLLIDSQAMDAGDPAIAFNPAEYDQRGAPFVRVFDGDGGGGPRIDMGAFESQPVLPTFGDYNRNGAMDAADYIVWRKTLGQSVPNHSAGDGDGDGAVEQQDYDVWTSHFGDTWPPDSGSGSTSSSSPSFSGEAVRADAASVGGFRISDFGLRRAENPAPMVRRQRPAPLAGGSPSLNDTALLGWLASRFAGDGEQIVEETIVPGQTADEAADRAIEEVANLQVAMCNSQFR